MLRGRSTAVVCFLSVHIVFLQRVHCKFLAEEVTSSYYDLSISSFPFNEDIKDDDQATTDSQVPVRGTTAGPNDFVAIGNKYGQKYQCRLPPYVEPEASSPQHGSNDAPSSSKVNNQEIQEILDSALAGGCLKTPKQSGAWWTYEFCYKSSISQYHVGNDNKQEGETIYLGHFESEKDWTAEDVVKTLTEKPKKTLYHAQTYTNGTLCDLTNTFRRAEVRFFCDENPVLTNDAYLHSVDEPESCEYVLTVHIGALCRSPAFLPVDRKPQALKIECQPVLSAAEFDKYIKDKEAEEAKKLEEAERKKKEEERKLLAEAEKRERQLMERKKLDQVDRLPGRSLFDTQIGKAAKEESTRTMAEGPLLEILGKSKADYLKLLDKKQTPSASKDTASSEGAKVDEPTNIGGVGTLEYEYMTHWLEEKLQELAMDDSVVDADEQLEAEKGLSYTEWMPVNEFKRKTRRLSLFMSFQVQLEELSEDVFDTVVWWDKKLEKLTKGEKAQALKKVKFALTKALTNLVEEMEAVERIMEVLKQKTDLAGLAAFQTMREQAENKKRQTQNLQESEISAAESAKPSQGAPENINSKQKSVDEEGKKRRTGKAAANVESTINAASKTETQLGSARGENVGGKMEKDDLNSVSHESTRGLADKEGSSHPRESIITEDDDNHGANNENLAKHALKEEMDTQLGQLMGDVARELEEEGAFEGMNDAEVTEVKTQALQSLAKTLTNLLQKLDDAERDDDPATAQAAEESELKKSSKSAASMLSSKRRKGSEKRKNAWRALMEELDDEQPTEKSSASERKSSVKRDDSEEQEEKNKGAMRVRVSTIKKKDEEGEVDTEDPAKLTDTEKLERRIAEKLQEAGFDTQGRPVQVKIISTLNLDGAAENTVHVLSEEEAEQFTNVVFSILGGGTSEQLAEQRRHQSLENSYSFGAASESAGESKETKKSAPMKTVVAGGP